MKEIKEKTIWQYKLSEYLLYFLIFMTPLFMAKGGFAVFNAPKVIFMIGCVSLISIFFVFGKMKKDISVFSFSYIQIILTLFIIMISVSSIYGLSPLHSFFGNWRDSISLILIYYLSIFACILGSLIKKDKRVLVNTLVVSVLSSLVVSFITYLPKGISGYPSDSSTIGNSSYVGAYLIFNALFALGLVFYFKKLWKRIFTFIAFLFISLSPIFLNKLFLVGDIGFSKVINNPFILMGSANAATLGLVFSIIVFISFILIKNKNKIFKIIGFIIFVGVILSSFYTGSLLINKDSSLHRQFIEEKTGNRFLAWDIANEGFKDKPVLGNGFDTFSLVYQKHFTKEFYEEGNTFEWFTHPHNVFWEYLSGTGVVGLALFLILLIGSFLIFIVEKRDDERYLYLKLAISSAVFGYFVQNLFGFDTPTSYLMLFLVFGISIYYSSNKYKIDIPLNKTLTQIVHYFSIIIFIYSLIVFVILPTQERKIWNSLSSTEAVSKTLSKDIQRMSLMGDISDTEYMVSKFIDVYKNNLDKINDSNKNIVLSQINKIISFAERDIKSEVNSAHAYILSSELMNIGMMIEVKEGGLYKFGEGNYSQQIWEKSKSYLDKAMMISKENKSIYENLAQLYVLKGDMDMAYTYAKESIKLAPNLKSTYDLPKQLLKISPNKEFEKFMNETIVK